MFVFLFTYIYTMKHEITHNKIPVKHRKLSVEAYVEIRHKLNSIELTNLHDIYGERYLTFINILNGTINKVHVLP